MKAIAVVLFIGIINTSVYGQDMLYKNYTNLDGLPSMQVYDIYQDVNGFMWFATDRGISRYNGYEFQSYSIKDGLTSNTVFKFYPQDNGNIWCTTLNGSLFYFNPKDYRFTPFKFNDKLNSLIPGYVVDDLLIDINGSVSLSFTDKLGLITIDSLGKNISKSFISDNIKYRDGNYTMVIEEINNKYIGILEGNNYHFQTHLKNSKIISTLKTKDHDHSKSIQFGNYSVFKTNAEVYLKKGEKLIKKIESTHAPINVGKLNNNSFWVGYRFGGIVMYNEKGEIINHILNGKSTTFLFNDHLGGLWISTLSSGVYYAENPNIKKFKLPGVNHIFELNKDENNLLWVSTYDRVLYSKIGEYFKEAKKISKLNSPYQ